MTGRIRVMVLVILLAAAAAAALLFAFRRVEAAGYARGRNDQTVADLEDKGAAAAAIVAHDSVVAAAAHEQLARAIDSVHVTDSLRRVARGRVTLVGDTAVIARPPAVSLTPNGTPAADTTTSRVPLPPEVAEIIRRDDEDLAAKNVELTLARLAHATDSVQVADLRAEHAVDRQEIDVLKATRAPRFGFKSGVAAGASAAVIVVKILAAIL